MSMDLHSLGAGPLAFVGVYLLAVLGLGVYVNFTSRRKTMHDHYIAGGGLGYFGLAMTVFATQVHCPIPCASVSPWSP